MRGGARMICSPYLTGSLALMLVLVTFNYWSVSTNNFDLVKEVKMMQTQLKTGSGTIQEKERDMGEMKEELKAVRQSLEKCKGEKATLESVKESLKICNTEKQTCEREKVGELEQARKEGKKVKDNLLNKSQKLTEEKEVLERRTKELEEEVEGAKRSLKDLEGEVASLRAEQLKPKVRPAIRLTGGGGGGGDVQESAGLGRGQLPDVDPKAVSVVQKETRGMTFHLDSSGRHYLPILPRGNPKAPRPPPLHSVMNLRDPKAAPAKPSSKSGGPKDLKDPKAPMPSPKSQEDPQSSRTKRHLLFPGSGSDGDHPLMAPRHLPPGPSSPKPRGISSSSSVKSVGLVDNVAGVMPPPNNLDQAEDDANIPLHKNGPEGKIMLEEDDQDPNGQIDELVDPEKQQFLQDKAMKAETKDIVVEGREDTRSRKEKREEEEEDLDPVINSESLKVET